MKEANEKRETRPWKILQLILFVVSLVLFAIVFAANPKTTDAASLNPFLYWIYCLLALAICVLVGIIAGLFGIGDIDWLETIGVIVNFVLIIFFIPAMLGVEASIYRQLSTGEFLADKDIKEGLKDIKNDVVGAVKQEKSAPAAEPAKPAAEPAPAAPAAEEPAKKEPKAKKD